MSSQKNRHVFAIVTLVVLTASFIPIVLTNRIDNCITITERDKNMLSNEYAALQISVREATGNNEEVRLESRDFSTIDDRIGNIVSICNELSKSTKITHYDIESIFGTPDVLSDTRQSYFIVKTEIGTISIDFMFIDGRFLSQTYKGYVTF